MKGSRCDQHLPRARDGRARETESRVASAHVRGRGHGVAVGSPAIQMPDLSDVLSPEGAGARTGLRRALATPGLALRETAANQGLLAVQLCWTAVNLSTWTSTVALTVAAFDLGGPTAVATAVVVRTLPSAVVGPLLAAAVRHWPSRQVLAVAAVAVGMSAGGSAVATRSFPALLGLGLLLTSVTMVFRAAQSAVLPELATGPRQLASANVLIRGIEAAGVFAGPALAGLAISLGGTPLAFAIAATAALVGSLSLALFPTVPARAQRQADLRQPRAGRYGLLHQPAVRLLLGLVLAQTMVAGGLWVLAPSLAEDVYGLGGAGVGALTSAYGLGGVVGSVTLFALAGSSRLGAATAGALVLWAAPLLALAAVGRVHPALLLLAIVGIGNVLFDLTIVTLLQRAAAPSLLAATFSTLEVAVVLGSSGGAAVTASLAGLLGPAATLLVLGLPLLALGIAALPALRRLDRDLAAPSEQVALLRGLPAFALLATPEIERLALQLRRVPLGPGETVVLQGDTGSAFWLVAGGRLAVEVDGRTVAELTAGDAFGEIALLHDVPRTATVRTLTRCDLWELDRAAFLDAARHVGSRRSLADLAHVRLARAAPTGLAGPVEGSQDDPGRG